ncbi:MAG: dockerin type I repeat-containing protein [Clostridiales bacterium]|nr:dockerin type I repeat-containing protein [Clostridiales bacterium]MCD7827843.1 dockerin type I repeat-containing protein [Clostridiales bacterium]
MKNNIGLKTVIAAITILAVACTIGASSVSALSEEGESLLNVVVSAGSDWGFDISGLIPTSAAETTETTVYYENAEGDLQSFISGLNMSVMEIIDLINYIQQGGSFEDWIAETFGEAYTVPESVESLSADELLSYISGMALNSAGSTGETTTKYQFVPSSTAAAQTESEKQTEQSEQTEQIEYTTQESDENTQSNTETADSYMTGDANGDGKVTAADARLALRAGAQLTELSELEFYAADVNGDGNVTAKDARSILRYAAGIASSF